MNKVTPQYVSQAPSLVMIMSKKHHHDAAGNGFIPHNGYVQDAWRDMEDVLLAHQLSELKEQLWQRDAAIADHNAKSQEQAAIIDTLIQHLSKMEDQLHIPHQKYMVDKMHHKILSFQEENKQRIKYIKHLEDELTKMNRQVKELMSLLKIYELERQDDFPNTELTYPSYFASGKMHQRDECSPFVGSRWKGQAFKANFLLAK